MNLRRALLAAGVVVLVLLFVGGWLLVRPLFDRPSLRLLDYAADAADPASLTVRAERTCGDRIGRAEVVETDDRVEVTVPRTSSDPDAVCAAVYREWAVEVTLDKSLADRPVYDGGCLARGRADATCRLAASPR
ncbi:hypothetical protein ABFU82_15980 [Nocardioides sp. WV_118_6]